MFMCVVLLSQMLHAKCLCVVLLSQMSHMLNVNVCCPVISDVTLNVCVLSVKCYIKCVLSCYLRCYMLNVYVCCPVISDVTC